MTTVAALVVKAVGTGHGRVEGRDKVTGAARDTGEIPFADANAVWHATGVRHRNLPIRPDRVLTAGAPGA